MTKRPMNPAASVETAAWQEHACDANVPANECSTSTMLRRCAALLEKSVVPADFNVPEWTAAIRERADQIESKFSTPTETDKAKAIQWAKSPDGQQILPAAREAQGTEPPASDNSPSQEVKDCVARGECPKCHAKSDVEAGTRCQPEGDSCPAIDLGLWPDGALVKSAAPAPASERKDVLTKDDPVDARELSKRWLDNARRLEDAAPVMSRHERQREMRAEARTMRQCAAELVLIRVPATAELEALRQQVDQQNVCREILLAMHNRAFSHLRPALKTQGSFCLDTAAEVVAEKVIALEQQLGEARAAISRLELGTTLDKSRADAKERMERAGVVPGFWDAWRSNDPAKLPPWNYALCELAILDALTQEGIAAWYGDASGCVTQIVEAQAKRAAAAEHARTEAEGKLAAAQGRSR